MCRQCSELDRELVLLCVYFSIPLKNPNIQAMIEATLEKRWFQKCSRFTSLIYSSLQYFRSKRCARMEEDIYSLPVTNFHRTFSQPSLLVILALISIPFLEGLSTASTSLALCISGTRINRPSSALMSNPCVSATTVPKISANAKFRLGQRFFPPLNGK